MFKYLAAFVVLCLGQQCRCFSVTKLGYQETDVDEFFTQLLYSLSESLVGLYGNEIPIPDFNCAFGNSRMEGRISATGGSLGDLSTLQFENVSVLTTPESILLNVEIRMGNLQVSFDHLEASFRYFSVEGSGRLSAQENLLSVQARMTFTDDQCVAVLNFLKLRIFDQLVVNLSVEQSPINDQLLNRIFEVGMKKHKNLLISKIENRLKEVVNGSLKDICDFLV